MNHKKCRRNSIKNTYTDVWVVKVRQTFSRLRRRLKTMENDTLFDEVWWRSNEKNNNIIEKTTQQFTIFNSTVRVPNMRRHRFKLESTKLRLLDKLPHFSQILKRLRDIYFVSHLSFSLEKEFLASTGSVKQKEEASQTWGNNIQCLK